MEPVTYMLNGRNSAVNDHILLFVTRSERVMVSYMVVV